MASTTSTILWDLETCFPSDIAASDAVAAIRKLVAPRSTIQQMLAFWNSNHTKQTVRNSGQARTGSFSNTQEYRNALHRQGVVPVDSAFLDGEAVVKAMMGRFFNGRKKITLPNIEESSVEMFKGIIDGRFNLQRTIIVISNNTSLEYSANLLKERHFKVSFFDSWTSVLSAGGSSQSDNVSPSGSPVVGSTASQRLPDPTHELDQANHSTNAIAGGAPPPPPYTVRPPADVKPEIIQHFHVLIEVFQSLADRGETRISRADLGNEIIKASSPNVYKEAGFKDFKKYVQAAEQFGLIIVGGGGSESWAELRSEGSPGIVEPPN
ncbi:hypothetical protein EST38_g1665 [Candolleomyces aberdarensis]|uniref:NYN domain-containing protein n=1 Tax=Candolleomyces aberdarensis TaxID=2316362 RepID=A0A4Q2DVB6_9AGAR|nr:hypothetical protein EST38_g1665 [Candolleomyces aberdarensis]